MSDAPLKPSIARLLRRLPSPQAPLGTRERVWRHLVGEPPPRSRISWIAALGGAACAAAVLAAVIAPGRGTVAAVVVATGEVDTSTNGTVWVAPKPDQALEEGARLRTHDSGHAYVRFDDAGALFGAHTTASVRHHGWRRRGIEVGLVDGTVVVADDPRPADRAFVVTAGDYTVRVLGTVFSVMTSDDQVEVRVQEGKVEVTGPQTDVRLEGGQSWHSRRGLGREALSASDAQEAVALLHPERSRAAPLASPEPTPVQAPSPVTDAVAHPAQRTRPIPAKVAIRTQAPEVPSKTAPFAVAVGGSFDDITVLRAKLVGATTQQERERLSYQLGRALTAAGDYAGAVSAYGVAAEGTSARAELSLYEIGRLELRRVGDPSAAATAFRQAQTRFPQGQLDAEVQLSLIEALLDTRAFDEASRAMDGFLIRFPQSERRAEVLGLRANLRRQQGDCKAALDDYAALMQGPAADDALYFSAFCTQKLGDRQGARRLLERYRSVFPLGRHQEEVDRALEAQ